MPCRTFPLPYEVHNYLWRYEGLARDIIRALKYSPSLYLCRWLADMIYEQMISYRSDAPWDLIVPIPASYSSRKRRQFNQCEIMARQIAKHVSHNSQRKIPVRNVLSITKRHTPQALLTPEQRFRRRRELFTVNRSVHNARILLIDDVITTGVTVAAAAVALKAAGAGSVEVISAALSSNWHSYRARVHARYGVLPLSKNSG